MEIYSTSNLYGAAAILKRHAKITPFIPTPAKFQHGWYLGAYPGGVADLDSIGVWCWSQRIAAELQQLSPDKPIHTIGATFLYLMQLLDMRPYAETTPRQRGSIVFPCHSSRNIQVKCNHEQYAEMLSNLGDDFRPISVCVYESDLSTGYAEIFRQRGFEIVTNGRRSRDPDFLTRFIKNTDGKRYALSNQMTSALLYASALGATSFLYGPKFEMENKGDPLFNGVDLTACHDDGVRHYGKYFSFESADRTSQQEFTSDELGLYQIKSPRELRKLFIRCAASFPYLRVASAAYTKQTGRRIKDAFLKA